MKNHNPNRFAVLGLLAVIGVVFYNAAAYAQTFYGGHFVGQTVPDQLVTQAQQSVEVVLKNVGTEAWKADNGVLLAIGEAGLGKSWGIDKVELAADEIVGPGETKTFEFTLSAPAEPGTYHLSWQLMRAGKPIPGIHSPVSTIRVDDPHTRAKFVSQLVPDRLAPGERFKVLIQFENAGESSWSDENGFYLGATTAAAESTWGIGNVNLSARDFIAPGQTATFSFEATAPRKAGEYPFEWQLHHDKGRGFGEPSPQTVIRVGQPESPPISDTFRAEFMSQTVPETMIGGDEYSVALVFKNTGDSPWRHGHIALISQEPDNNLTWFINRVELQSGEVIAPGAIKVFSFKVKAPNDAGHYPFRWRLADRENRKFGDASEEQLIVVK